MVLNARTCPSLSRGKRTTFECGPLATGTLPLPRSQLFTVRMWLEDLGEGQREWRGKVQLVANGKACYFRDWPTLIAFLEQARSQAEQAEASEASTGGKP